MQSTTLEPGRILAEIGLTDRSRVADFGCGPGVFSLPAARLTRATVHSIDIREPMLDVCVREAEHQNLSNVEVSHANIAREGGSELANESVDFVIMRKIISQNEKKDALFSEAYRVLVHGGILLVIGWRDSATVGPSRKTRVSMHGMRALADASGFDAVRELTTDHDHFGLAFTKK